MIAILAHDWQSLEQRWQPFLSRLPHYVEVDVEWAGEFRQVPLSKQAFANNEDATAFTPPSRLRQELQKLFDQLAAQDSLKNFSQTLFVECLTPHFIALKHIHPFHEGNGRAQTLFWRKIARGA